MHTVQVIVGGFALLGLMVFALDRFIGRAKAALLFIPVWLIAAAINLAVGVSSAGYSVADEAPVFVIVFGVPAGLACLVYRWSRGPVQGAGG